MRQARPSSFIVGIGGGTASGKSTLCARIEKNAPAGVVSVIFIDSYYRSQDRLSIEERARTNYDHPDALEFDLLARHLFELQSGAAVEIPVYDFAVHTRLGRTAPIKPAQVILVEGILSLYPASLRSFYDLNVFVDAPSELRLQRRLARDVKERGRTAESVYAQWNATVQPMYLEFCEPTRKFADIVASGVQVDEALVAAIIARTNRP